MQDLLLLGEGQDGAVYLLNPKVKTSNGEWEAWNFANWYPGAYRYPSFRSMVLNTHKSLMQESRLPPSNVAQGQDENPSVQVEESPIIDEAFIEVALPLLRDKIKQGVDPADAVAGYIKIKSQKSKS